MNRMIHLNGRKKSWIDSSWNIPSHLSIWMTCSALWKAWYGGASRLARAEPN